MYKEITIENKKGIHARTAAIIISFVNKLSEKYNSSFYIKRNEEDELLPLSSMLVLTSLGLKKGDNVILCAKGDDSKEALKDLANYFSGQIDSKILNIEEFDKVLEENTNTINEELNEIKEVKNMLSNILNHISDGICLMDKNGIINYLNPSYEDIFNTKKDNLIGKNAYNEFPNRPSLKALKEKTKILDVSLKNEDKFIISNSTPIYIKDEFIGIITSYKDMTKIKEMISKLNYAKEEIKYYKDELDKKTKVDKAFDLIIGNSDILKDSLALSSKAAKTSANVIIRGESGTGKELVAKAIHEASNKKDGPFIKINCAAIPSNLLESELFGHEKGSFTGASSKKIGKFELAHNGTLFLDEIGEISFQLQAKLLRAIQEKEFERVGGIKTIKTNIRIIAATHRNLEEMVKNNEFREDLYYRLNVIPINLPPLRNRNGDISLLVEHFNKKICQSENIKLKQITNNFLEILKSYTWPGNIRELENIMTRVITLSEGNYLDTNTLPSYIIGNNNELNQNKNSFVNIFDGELKTMEEYDKQIIKLALDKYKSFNKAAKALGITHRTVALKARKYNLID
ncbi:MAG: HPr family phosphocarrier protein [Peptostreptococcaceae bacterium]|jgi:phosphotransferase system HPr (HPr) family protein|nr:HPr family phosphocarrier protein [Peptostreptococcaceae bacterium]